MIQIKALVRDLLMIGGWQASDGGILGGRR